MSPQQASGMTASGLGGWVQTLLDWQGRRALARFKLQEKIRNFLKILVKALEEPQRLEVRVGLGWFGFGMGQGVGNLLILSFKNPD